MMGALAEWSIAMKTLTTCLFVLASIPAAIAQPQSYPASPYLSGAQTPSQQQSPYFGTNNQPRGYLTANPYDPDSVYGAGYRFHRARPSRTGGIKR
jgi:hypothetical protein